MPTLIERSTPNERKIAVVALLYTQQLFYITYERNSQTY